jgi:hypothetical protein
VDVVLESIVCSINQPENNQYALSIFGSNGSLFCLSIPCAIRLLTKHVSSHTPDLPGELYARRANIRVGLATSTCLPASSAGLDFHCVNIRPISCKSGSETFLASVRSTIRTTLDA